MDSQPLKTLNSEVRLPEIDGLRGCAILLVLAFHYLIVGLRWGPPAMYWSVWVFQLGWSGVDLFFVLSGFLIGGIIFDHRNSKNMLKVFYIRRAFRILPLYLVMLALYVAGIYLVDHRVRTNFALPFFHHGPIWPYATFMQNYWMIWSGSFGCIFNGVTWSLAVEEHFYLVIPILLLLLPNRFVPYALALLITIAVAARWSLSNVDPNSAYYMTHTRMDTLCMGVLLAWSLRQPELWDRVRRGRVLLTSLCIAFFLVYFWVLTYDSNAEAFAAKFTYSYFAVFYTLLSLFCITFTDSLLARIMRGSVLRFFGKHAYCIYLVHQFMNVLAFAYLRNKTAEIESFEDLQAPAVALAGSIAIAYLSMRYFESAMIRFGHRFKYEC